MAQEFLWVCVTWTNWCDWCLVASILLMISYEIIGIWEFLSYLTVLFFRYRAFSGIIGSTIILVQVNISIDLEHCFGDILCCWGASTAVHLVLGSCYYVYTVTWWCKKKLGWNFNHSFSGSLHHSFSCCLSHSFWYCLPLTVCCALWTTVLTDRDPPSQFVFLASNNILMAS